MEGVFSIRTTTARQFVAITGQLQEAVDGSGIRDGILFVFNPHTTAGLTINEGADPAVCQDLLGVLARMTPGDFPYRHQEGNSPAHLMTLLTGSSLQVGIGQGRLQLGAWQQIFFCEYDGPRQRTVRWKILAG